jgi:hypothetical protein
MPFGEVRRCVVVMLDRATLSPPAIEELTLPRLMTHPHRM